MNAGHPDFTVARLGVQHLRGEQHTRRPCQKPLRGGGPHLPHPAPPADGRRQSPFPLPAFLTLRSLSPLPLPWELTHHVPATVPLNPEVTGGRACHHFPFRSLRPRLWGNLCKLTLSSPGHPSTITSLVTKQSWHNPRHAALSFILSLLEERRGDFNKKISLWGFLPVIEKLLFPSNFELLALCINVSPPWFEKN